MIEYSSTTVMQRAGFINGIPISLWLIIHRSAATSAPSSDAKPHLRAKGDAAPSTSLNFLNV